MLLVFLVVTAVLIFALLPDAGDGESMSGFQSAAPFDAESHTPSGVGAAPLPTVASSSVEELEAASLALDTDATESSWPEPEGSVVGRLIDGLGRGVEGEPVALLLERDPWLPKRRDGESEVLDSARSATDGSFRLRARPGSALQLLAGGDDWAMRRLESVTEGDDIVVSLTEGLVLEGHVIEQETGAPVAEAFVMTMVDGQAAFARGDANGAFRMGPVPDDEIILAAYAPGHGVYTEGDIVASLGPVTAELPPGRELFGRVFDETTGEPVAGASLRFAVERSVFEMAGGAPAGDGDGAGGDALLSSGGPGWRDYVAEERESTSADDGSFSLGPGPSVGFSLEVEAPGYVPHTIEKYVERNLAADAEIEVPLRPVANWLGQVLDADTGEPVAGVDVTASAADDAGVGSVLVEGMSDDEGRFALSMEAWNGVGAVYLAATEGGDEDADEAALSRHARERVAKDGEETILQLVEPLRTIVRVEADGQPVPGASVAARSERAETTVVVTGDDGTASLVHRLSGPGAKAQRVRVSARHGARTSLTTTLDLIEEPPAEEVLIDFGLALELAGIVADPYGQPISAALVTSNRGPRAYSDEQGRFRVAPVERDQEHQLFVRAEGFKSKRVVTVAGYEELYISLDPIITWEGRVVDAASGLVVNGFSGTLYSVLDAAAGKYKSMRGYRARSVPGVPGAFRVPLPAAGRYMVRFSARDYITADGPILDFNGSLAPPTADVLLSPAAVLVVQVEDGRGLPIEGLRVDAVPVGVDGRPLQGKSALGRRRTDRNGEVRLNLGTGGSFKLRSYGWLDERVVRVTPGPALEWVCRVPTAGDLQVHVTDPQGMPVIDARVRVKSSRKNNDYSISRRVSVRSADGVIVDDLPPGEYTVSVSRRHWTGASKTAFVPQGRTQRVDLVMQPHASNPAPAKKTKGSGANAGGGARKKLQQLGYTGGR